MKRSLAAVGAVVVVLLALAGTAAADKEKIQLTKAGQAAARAAVVRRADLGPASGWTGGAKKPVLTQTLPCPYHPKQSDLVLIGAAQTVWKHAGLQFDSEAQVLQTPAMVRLDWQRTVLAPQMLPCVRSELVKGLGTSARLVSLKALAFPRLASYTRAYRALVDVRAGTGSIRVMIDLVLVGRGRTEITLSTTAQAAASPFVLPAEKRLALLLLSRVRT